MSAEQRACATPLQKPSASGRPDIRLVGKVDESMLKDFLQQRDNVAPDRQVVIELSSSGGEADIGRRIAYDLKQWVDSGRDIVVVGKTFVYSAGVSIMSGVPASQRYLTSDCELLIHERKIKKELHLEGALRGCRSEILDALAEIDSGQRLEREGFAQLVAGSTLSLDDLMAKVLERDWYVPAAEAVRLGLVAAIVD